MKDWGIGGFVIGGLESDRHCVRFIERFYKELQTTKAVDNPYKKPKKEDEYVTPSAIRDIHKLLRSCFKQAVKWELMEKNPAEYATVPKYEEKPRDIWTAETLMYALSVCKDDNLKLAIHLSFSCSLPECRCPPIPRSLQRPNPSFSVPWNGPCSPHIPRGSPSSAVPG